MAKNAKPKPKATNASSNHRPAPKAGSTRTYTILDYRLEKPTFELRQVRDGDAVRYEVSGTLNGAVPPIRDSKYLNKQQCIEIYRWMLLNRKMETALENLYKQGKVVGGVYFGLGQEACSCASAYALKSDEWLGPMIRNICYTNARQFLALSEAVAHAGDDGRKRSTTRSNGESGLRRTHKG